MLFLKIKDELVNLDKVKYIKSTKDRITFWFNGNEGISFYCKYEGLYYGDVFNILLSNEEFDILKEYLKTRIFDDIVHIL